MAEQIWPAPLFKNGQSVRYAHNPKELAALTRSEEDGGPGYSTQYVPQEWPKVVFKGGHRAEQVADPKALKKKISEGYSLDPKEHVAVVEVQALPTPGERAEIADLKSQVAELKALVALALETKKD